VGDLARAETKPATHRIVAGRYVERHFGETQESNPLRDTEQHALKNSSTSS
jgi:hypothetical protein